MPACTPSLPHGEFGPYYRRSKHLLLPTGDTLLVYQVKYWNFSSGEPPALQLEYEAPFKVSDTNAVRREAVLLWPFFEPYVEAQHLQGAIITATNLRISGLWPVAWTSRDVHFGFIIVEEEDGRWHFAQDSVTLPPGDASGIPRIIDVTGEPLPFRIPFPTQVPQ